MATNPTICVKALVDKGSNKVILVESGNDLVDTLFSYLTTPMGTVIELARKHSDPAVIGCMKNLYASVESIGEEEFLGNIFKDLLHPRSAAEPLYRNLNFKLHNVRPLRYYMCFDSGSCKFLSYESDVQCPHHLFHNEPIMDWDNCLSVGASQILFGDKKWYELGKVSVKLASSKSKKIVDLLFSFLTLPLGFIAKNMKEGSLNGRIGWKCCSIPNLFLVFVWMTVF